MHSGTLEKRPGLEKRSGEATRQRILDAALARFARASYDEVTLRDIAGDVGVDVALVHRSFGSKEQLFAAAFTAAIQVDRLLAHENDELSAVFANDIFERDSSRGSTRADALQIFIRSLSSPLTRDILHAYASRDFIASVAAKIDGPARQQRAALFAACLIGVSILRDVLHLEPLGDASRKKSQPLIEKILGVCLDEACEAVPSTARLASVKAKIGKPRGLPASDAADGSDARPARRRRSSTPS
ncbi:MAG: TetR/AcrR family transcriptional regulator [Methylocystaceae bacterium]|nr:MAG: TetR/AcrR family transcriptional regulator [Methylocystaceae bacterium]